MKSFFRKMLNISDSDFNVIEIDAQKIIANFNYLKSRQRGAEIFPVLKANAYGHGLAEMGAILNYTSAPLVAVDNLAEAKIAWRNFKRQVLILGEMALSDYRLCDFRRTEFVVYSSEILRELARYKKRAKVHLFVNSGMNREGIKDLPDFIINNKKYLDKVEITGFCSHLSSADEDSIFNEVQEEKFMTDLETLRLAGYSPRWIHLGNSAALLRMSNPVLTAFRPGLALYGYSPFSDVETNDFDESGVLQPALRIFSRVVSVQNIKPDEVVSYNESYRATKETTIAVVPFGYFEGLDRRLSNKAEFLINGVSGSFLAPVAGKICMNLCCLDVDGEIVKKGDIVNIVSDRNSDPNSVLNLARQMNTVPHEFLVKLQPGLKRVIVR